MAGVILMQFSSLLNPHRRNASFLQIVAMPSLRKLRAVAERKGCTIVKVYKDHGISGASHWRCCSLLRVDPGKIILGDFYLDHSCNTTAGPLSTGRK